METRTALAGAVAMGLLLIGVADVRDLGAPAPSGYDAPRATPVAAAVGVAEASTSSRLRFGVATQNVCDFGRSDMAEGEVGALVGRVIRTLGRGGIAGLQEIGSRGHRRGTAEAVAASGWGLSYGTARPGDVDSPVMWDERTWRRVDSGRDLLHGPIPGLPAPSRWLVWLLLERRADGLRLGVVSLHPVAGAWAHRTPRQALRRRQWRRGQRVAEQRVALLAEAHGQVLLVGDMNRVQGHPDGWLVPDGTRGLTVLGPTRVDPESLDHLYLVSTEPGRWAHGDLVTRTTRSDHPMRRVEVVLRGGDQRRGSS